MGIPNFYGNWIRRHNSVPSARGMRANTAPILSKYLPRLVSSFSIDMNGLFHKVAQKVYAYGEYYDEKKQKLLKKEDPAKLEYELFDGITSKLLEVLASVNPTDLLVMAVDGIAPVAKMDQQRKRRFISSSSASEGNVRQAKDIGSTALFNSNQITPGTELMFKLDTHIRKWISDNQLQLPPHVIYSCHMVPGEGEHKIFDLMREGRYNVPINQLELKDTSLAAEAYVARGAHVIYGLDADLIMLSLLAPLDNLYLSREDLADIVVIDNLKGLIRAEGLTVDSFVVMSFLIGNDFLPHQPSLEDVGFAFDRVLELARNLPLVKEGEISWSHLSQLMTSLAEEEPRLLTRELERQVKHTSKLLEESAKKKKIIQGNRMAKTIMELDMSKFIQEWHQHLGPHDHRVASKLGLNFMPVSQDRIRQQVFDYLDGINWVFHYYRGGLRNIDPLWFYPHHYTPLFVDIKDYIGDYVPRSFPLMGEVPYNVVHQLLSVLPRSSQKLIPKEARALMDINSPVSDLYPETFLIDLNGKNYDYQGVALLPHVAIGRVIDAVARTTYWSPEAVERYASQSAEELIRDEATQQALENQRIVRQKLRGRGRGRGPAAHVRRIERREESSSNSLRSQLAPNLRPFFSLPPKERKRGQVPQPVTTTLYTQAM